MNLRKKFSEADLQRIKATVKEAESKISGEIVPVIVERSGAYAIASYRAGALFAMLTFAAIIIIDQYVPSLAIYDPLTIFVAVLIGGLFGGLLAHYLDPFKKRMLTQLHLDKATRLKAESSFLEQEVFNTRQRTGIMIFISFFEHEVIVMADKGISKVVEQKEWDTMVQAFVSKIKMGDTVGGLEACIKKCAQILLEKDFAISADDINELKDDLRIE
jgi:putative membrane protein